MVTEKKEKKKNVLFVEFESMTSRLVSQVVIDSSILNMSLQAMGPGFTRVKKVW